MRRVNLDDRAEDDGMGQLSGFDGVWAIRRPRRQRNERIRARHTMHTSTNKIAPTVSVLSWLGMCRWTYELRWEPVL